MRRWIIVILGALLLVGINYEIYQKEQLLKTGRVLLLRLAPVDPRSLMQGDYMALRYEAEDALLHARTKNSLAQHQSPSTIVMLLDSNKVAEFARFDDGRPLGAEEVRVRYRVQSDRVYFATNAFFFQEGDEHLYTSAKYGVFRAAESGEIILAGLQDDRFSDLGAPAEDHTP